MNEAKEMLDQCLRDRKEYKRKVLNVKSHSMDNVVSGVICTKMVKYFDPSKLKIGFPYLLTFTEDIVIFAELIPAKTKFFIIVGDVTDTEIKCVRACNGDRYFQQFVLTPDMAFYLEEAVSPTLGRCIVDESSD